MVVVNINNKSYSIDGYLKNKLDNIKTIQKQNWDCVFCVDGIEGAGKSTLAIQCAYYLSSGKFNVDNICAGTQEAIEKLQSLPDEEVLMMDESSLIFNSRESARKEQIQIIKVLTIIRQKRMVLIIVAPSFFDLNKYISVHRSRFLLHVYTSKGLKRGRFAYFGTKNKRILYELGKKNYNSYRKPRANFVATFPSFNPFGLEYDNVKKKALIESLSTDKPKISHVDKKKFEVILTDEYIMRNEELKLLPLENLAKLMGISRKTLYNRRKTLEYPTK